MNPSPLQQTIGTACVAIAGLLYAVPLQYLLLELSRKRDDGGGVLAGIIILVPMWLLLLAALLCVTSSGGFDGLRLPRPALHTLVVLATLAMTVLSFLRFEFPRHPDFVTRFVSGVPIYVFPVATMLLVLFSLNPRFVPDLPLQAVRLPWLACAVISLALCGGFLSWRLIVTGKSHVAGFAHALSRRGVSDREILATIPNLDPQRDFAELLRRASQYQSRTVREAATTRLRTNPNFIEALAVNLDSRDPGSGLDFLCHAKLSPAEQNSLALPARNAIERFTSDIPAPNYMSSDRRKQLLSWGRRTLPVIANQFAASDVEFGPTLTAFEQALVPPAHRRN
jgi:hypothetical protein